MTLPEDPSENNASVDGADDTTNPDASPTNQNHLAAREKIAQRESRLVFWLRMAVVFFLTASATVVVVSVYRYMSQEEESKFDQKFENDASKIFETVVKTLDQTLGGADAFALQLLAYARFSNSTWPFVTMPGRELGVRVGKLLKLGDAFQLTIQNVVEPHQREEWEEYTRYNYGWLEETFDVMEADEEWDGEIYRDYNASGFFDIVGLSPEGGYAPVPEEPVEVEVQIDTDTEGSAVCCGC